MFSRRSPSWREEGQQALPDAGPTAVAGDDDPEEVVRLSTRLSSYSTTPDAAMALDMPSQPMV